MVARGLIGNERAAAYNSCRKIGNPAYREAFPVVEFIGHARLREYLPNQGATNRKNFLTQTPKFLEYLRGLLEKNRSLTDTALTEEERASLTSDTRLADWVLSEGPKTQLTLPTLTVEERLTLHRMTGMATKVLCAAAVAKPCRSWRARAPLACFIAAPARQTTADADGV